MKKRLFVFMLVLVMATGLFCGCKKETEEATKGQTRTAKTQKVEGESVSDRWIVNTRKAMLELEGQTGGWVSVYGQESKRMREGEYVQYTCDDNEWFRMDLVETESSPFREFIVYVYNSEIYEKDLAIALELSCGRYSAGQGIVAYKYSYWVRINCDEDELADIMSSFDSFKEAADAYLFVEGEYHGGDGLTESNFKAIFGSDDVTRYTEDELYELFYDDYIRSMEVLDYGLQKLDTSFEDAGIEY